MPFDGIVTACVARDMNLCLTGGKIEKVYQPESDEIVLLIHKEKEKYKVFITSNSMNSRLHFISELPPNPPQPPTFCMLLRKHLQGGKISRILQKDTERIVEIWIDAFNELGFPITKKLIVEIMGKHSNIVLVDDEKGKIIDCIKRVSVDVNRYRQILPGLAYIYPPAQNKIPFTQITKETLSSILRQGQSSLYQCLVSGIMGFSPFSASALCRRAGLSPQDFPGTLSPGAFERLWEALVTMNACLKEGRDCCRVWMDPNGVPIEFHCLDHPDYSETYRKIDFSQISEAADFFYQKKTSSNRIRQKSSDLMKFLSGALDKLYLKKERLSEEILQAEGADQYRLKGELLLANLYQIRPGMKQITVENYYDQSSMQIQLDPLLSPSDNSQKYYKKYNKAKTALREKRIQLEEAQKEIDYLESVFQSVENASDYSDVDAIRQELSEGGYLKRRQKSKQKKSVSAPPHSFLVSGGFRVAAGRNNRQNDTLTLKTASGGDLWFHTKEIPGTHVILFTEGRTPSEKALAEAASIAAYFSKGKMSQNVPVDYTLVKYVKKPAGAKPGKVIFTHNKTLYVDPLLPRDEKE